MHRRRELYVGFPALKTILGHKLLPALADRMASKQAFEGQGDAEAPPPEADRRDNLFSPVPGDFGAHGRFDARSSDRSWQLLFSMHRVSISAAVLVILLLVFIAAALVLDL